MSWLDQIERRDGVWIDKETGERTYPSWAKRKERQIITPDYKLPITHREQVLAHALKEQLYQQDRLDGSVEKRVVIDALVAVLPKGTGRKEAWRSLLGLWRCGLVTRFGVKDSRSGRLKYQRWQLTI